MGLVADPEIHGYHCGCEACDFTSDGLPLMVQRDSTCTGEVISRPMQTDGWDRWGYSEQLFGQLQQAALDVDAEPGEQAGFHVHVMPLTPQRAVRRSLLAFMLWEPVLTRIAAGRFPAVRQMNRLVRQDVSYPRLLDWVYDAGNGSQEVVERIDRFRVQNPLGGRAVIDWPQAVQDAQQQGTIAQLGRLVHTVHTHNDRHSNLNVSTNHGTVEFRLWNSSRSAWRMEMFCQASVALTDEAVTTSLIDLGGVSPHQEFDEGFMDGAEGILRQALVDAGYNRLAELLERQFQYRQARLNSRWPAEFCVS